jgi:hypothetical protein
LTKKRHGSFRHDKNRKLLLCSLVTFTVLATNNVEAFSFQQVKQCFENKSTTTTATKVSEQGPLSAKIQIRNETIYKPIRSKKAWKLKYDRHERQTTRGFFSPVAKPYETFGELELDLRELVLKTLGAKVR